MSEAINFLAGWIICKTSISLDSQTVDHKRNEQLAVHGATPHIFELEEEATTGAYSLCHPQETLE
ncbi:MAG: hypothetical protein QM740_18815 [Acidovorax sp.]